MSDQCKNCIMFKDMERCEETECFIHESWYVKQLEKKIDLMKSLIKTLEGDKNE